MKKRNTMLRCKTLGTLFVDLDREGALDVATRSRALLHVRVCSRCAARLARVRARTAGLTALARGTADLVPPAHLEARIVSAFRERGGPRVARPSTQSAWPARTLGLAAAASIILLLLALAVGRRDAGAGAVPSAARAVLRPDPAGFVVLQPGASEQDLDSLFVVRVQLSRTSLAGLGWPLHEDGAGGDPVAADLILGQDGVARAIRLVE